MRQSAHRADTRTRGKKTHLFTKTSHSHAAPTRARVRKTSTSSSRHAHVQPNVALTRLSPKVLVASLGLTALVGTMGVSSVANATGNPLGSTASFASATFPTSRVVPTTSVQGSSAGSAVSRSSSRTAIEPSEETTGEWDLDGGTDSLDAGKVSVATASNPVVQEKMELYADSIPSGFNPDHPTGDVGNAYEFSQCTWWVYIRRHELGLPAGSHMGNGNQWAATARKLGYWVDNNPQVGDAMVFAAGQEGADPLYGHVAVVEKVENGSVTISETGASLNGKTMSRTFTNIHDFEYVHF